MTSSIYDFKAIRDAADKISGDIFGGPKDRMHDCPCCDEYSYNDEDDDPVKDDGVVRCDYCGGIDKPRKVPEKKLIKDGYMPPPPNCDKCSDGGWVYTNGGSKPCDCSAGAKQAAAQGQATQAAPQKKSKLFASCAQKSPPPKPSAVCTLCDGRGSSDSGMRCPRCNGQGYT